MKIFDDITCLDLEELKTMALLVTTTPKTDEDIYTNPSEMRTGTTSQMSTTLRNRVSKVLRKHKRAAIICTKFSSAKRIIDRRRHTYSEFKRISEIEIEIVI